MTARYPVVTFETAVPVMLSHFRAGRPVILVGSPGIGKTSLVEQVGELLGKPVWTIILAGCDPSDTHGMPVVMDGKLCRVPMREILEAGNSGAILFFDEISCAHPDSQASILRGFGSRVFGDVKLHPDAIICAAMNPAEQAPGGNELCAPLIGRCGVFELRPEPDEVRRWFETLGQPGSTLRALSTEFAATLIAAADLVDMDPTQEALETGALYASPRDWTQALKVAAAATDAGDAEALVQLGIEGNVGAEAAAAYFGYVQLRRELPSPEVLLASPETAPLPRSQKLEVACLGYLPTLARQDCWAAWAYAARLGEEVRAALARILVAPDITDPTKASPHFGAGYAAMTEILAEVGYGLEAAQ